ncbi:MAG: glycerol-3-phosphate responsive antiterminator [Clostridia bacterium]|nr:glycerol-3-phosphate responsive antiterminator [Clostridia bacterium]
MKTGSVIAALRADKDFASLGTTVPKLIFDLSPDINSIGKRLDAVHAVGKQYFVHIDLASVIGKDESGIVFLKKLGVDGIISTRTNIIKTAREHGIFTVQRFFIVDSHSVATTLESLKASKADMIEIMPGIIPRVIKSLREKIDTPIIAGGLIESKRDIENAIESGASAVSTSRTELWQM